MDAFRKHATKLREQVTKQQQAVLKQFSTSGYGGQGHDAIVTDAAELQRHQQLEKLYMSTKAAKQFQRDIVRGVENLTITGARQMEVVAKMSEDCRKYASESPGVGGTLARACFHYGSARMSIEKERENMHKSLSTQVAEPLKAMINGAPLEDARHLAQRYDRLRQEAEAQASDLERKQIRVKDGGSSADNTMKLQVAELKMHEMSSSMAVLGKEAIAALSAVESQQQRLTLNRLIAMVEAERTYHELAAKILAEIEAQMVSERQRNDSMPPTKPIISVIDSVTQKSQDFKLKEGTINQPQSVEFVDTERTNQRVSMFLAEVMHPFEGEGESELSLVVGDIVVVRQVSPTGWSEGECKGKAGWFPSAYVEYRNQVPASKVTETF